MLNRLTQYANSLMITIPLVSILTSNSSATVFDACNQIHKAKSTAHHSNQEQMKENSLLHSRNVLTLPGKREYLCGFQPYQFRSTYISKLFVMLLLSTMAGDLIFLLPVLLEDLFPLTIYFTVPLVVFPL